MYGSVPLSGLTPPPQMDDHTKPRAQKPVFAIAGALTRSCKHVHEVNVHAHAHLHLLLSIQLHVHVHVMYIYMYM